MVIRRNGIFKGETNQEDTEIARPLDKDLESIQRFWAGEAETTSLPKGESDREQEEENRKHQLIHGLW